MTGLHTNTSGATPRARLLDNYCRPINYLRLSITDRCNLRCRYCRSEEGIPFVPHDEILTFEELERLTVIFSRLGIEKVRVTGGEPFTRKGCMLFLQRLKKISGVKHLYITTNGVETGQYLDELAELGISGINLSLDTLDYLRFHYITRRDKFEEVIQTLQGIIERQIPLKINSVILSDTTDAEIERLTGFARVLPISVRFIERMPFSGDSTPKKLVNGHLLQRIQRIFPDLKEQFNESPSTARIFSLPGYKGSIGVIQGYSRLFCQTCNKIRITPTGMLKTCLYDNGVLDLKLLLRKGAEDKEIESAILDHIHNRCVNGHEAELLAKRAVEPSMASIGG